MVFVRGHMVKHNVNIRENTGWIIENCSFCLHHLINNKDKKNSVGKKDEPKAFDRNLFAMYYHSRGKNNPFVYLP